MIDLNLLSPSRQSLIKARIFFSLIERFMVSLVFAALLLTIMLLGMKIRLSDNLSSIRSRQVLATEYVTVNKEINELNRSVARIEMLQKEVVPSSLLLEDIASRAPEGVHLSFINFEIATLSVKISGHSNTRENLLLFEGALLESPYLTELDSPISNLFEKTDLRFSFNAILDLDTLKSEIDIDSPTEPVKL